MEGEAVRGSRSALPWTIPAAIVLWVLVQTLNWWQQRQPDDISGEFAIDVAQFLQFIYGYLIVVLVSHGLIRGVRFVWIVALVWQGIQAGFGFVNLALSGWSWDVIGDFSKGDNGFGGPEGSIGFYIGPFPVLVAVISFVLLLLPATQRWIEERSDAH